MKNFFFILCITGCSGNLKAQTAPQKGIIRYDMVMHLRAQVAKENPVMAAMVPELMHAKAEISFEGELFSIATKIEDLKVAGIAFNPSNMDGKHIINLKTSTERTEQTFGTHTYYTEKATIPKTTISYSNEIKKIAGYTCNKATIVTADKQQSTIWYTTAIPYAYGPQGLELGEIKGAVLQIIAPDQTSTAIRVDTTSFNAAGITANAKAKKITQEQMDDLTEEASSELAREAVKQAKSSKKFN